MGKERCDDVDDCLEPCGRQRIRCTAFVRKFTDCSNHIINADWIELCERRDARYWPEQRWRSASSGRSNAGDLVVEVAVKLLGADGINSRMQQRTVLFLDVP